MARVLIVALALAVASWPRLANAGEERGPVVLELFTSQGCSACPPADKLLGKLVRDQGVIALSFHVPYWDHMGWRDPFALPVSVQRQRGYARAMKERLIYTPQLVVQGSAHTVGHDKAAIERLMTEAPRAAIITIAITARQPPTLSVSIPTLELPQGGAQLWLIAFRREEEREVLDGENAGHTLHHINVVRWAGPVVSVEAVPVVLTVPAAEADGADGIALVLQRQRLGPVLAAGQVALR